MLVATISICSMCVVYCETKIFLLLFQENALTVKLYKAVTDNLSFTNTGLGIPKSNRFNFLSASEK